MLMFSPKLTNNVYAQIGFITLIGLSAKNAILIVEFAKVRVDRGEELVRSTVDAVKLRLRPIMMTALVACLGLLPAALSTGIGSDTQKPFAIVIVAGLVSRLFLGFFINPVLYRTIAREGDVLQV